MWFIHFHLHQIFILVATFVAYSVILYISLFVIIEHQYFKLTLGLKWNFYIRYIAKNPGKMIAPDLTVPVSIWLLKLFYKSQFWPKMEYCCHIRAKVARSLLSWLEFKSVPNPCWRIIIIHPQISLPQAEYRESLTALWLLHWKGIRRTSFLFSASSNLHG